MKAKSLTVRRDNAGSDFIEFDDIGMRHGLPPTRSAGAPVADRFPVWVDQQHAQRIEPPAGKEAIAIVWGVDIVPNQFVNMIIFDDDWTLYKR